jgi:hypothetical protein
MHTIRNFKGRDYQGDVGTDGWIILKWFLEKSCEDME